MTSTMEVMSMLTKFPWPSKYFPHILASTLRKAAQVLTSVMLDEVSDSVLNPYTPKP